MDGKTLLEGGASPLRVDGRDYLLRDVAGGREVWAVSGGKVEMAGLATADTGVHRIVAAHGLGMGSQGARPESPEASDAAFTAKFHAYLGDKVDGVRPAVARAMTGAGYVAHHSGGGIMLWRKGLDDGSRLLVSCEEGVSGLDGDPDARHWLVGRYGAGDAYLDLTEPLTLPDALAAAGRMPDPVDPGGTERCEAFPDIDAALAAAAGWAEEAAPLLEAIGHPGTVRAARVGEWEFGIVAPGAFPHWTLVERQGCDPDDPGAGTSGVTDHPTREASEAAFREAVAAARASLEADRAPGGP